MLLVGKAAKKRPTGRSVNNRLSIISGFVFGSLW